MLRTECPYPITSGPHFSSSLSWGAAPLPPSAPWLLLMKALSQLYPPSCPCRSPYNLAPPGHSTLGPHRSHAPPLTYSCQSCVCRVLCLLPLEHETLEAGALALSTMHPTQSSSGGMKPVMMAVMLLMRLSQTAGDPPSGACHVTSFSLTAQILPLQSWS